MAVGVRGTTLPDRLVQTFVVDGDRLRADPASDADLVSDGGWMLPGLVDAHTHPGTEDPSDTFDDDRLRQHLHSHDVPPTVHAAHEAGVTILAGTDTEKARRARPSAADHPARPRRQVRLEED